MTDAKGLSEVQRYWKSRDELVENECGAWVRYDDYAAMAERLKACEAQRDAWTETAAQYCRNAEYHEGKRDQLTADLAKVTAERDGYVKWINDAAKALEGKSPQEAAQQNQRLRAAVEEIADGPGTSGYATPYEKYMVETAQAALTESTQRGGFAAGQQEGS